MKRAPLTPAGRWSPFREGAAAATAGTRGEPGARGGRAEAEGDPRAADDHAEFVAARLLTRYGIVFRRLLERERLPLPWRDIVRVLRGQELRGDVRGGRFVQGFSGEQYALPEAVELMRRLRRARGDGRNAGLLAEREGREGGARFDTRTRGGRKLAATTDHGVHVSAADPLNLEGILTPEPRIPAQARRRVRVA
jgi:ATP-dependent Lhr-like helicase